MTADPPKQDALHRFLGGLRGSSVFLPHNPGNLGDRLIAMGSEHAIRAAGVRLIDDPRRAAWLFVQGGGGMNEYWGTQFARFLGMSERWPDQPLAVLPSTYRFSTDAFAKVVASRVAETVLFARDRASLAYLESLKRPSCVRAELANDSAFSLADSEFVRGLRARRATAKPEHVLVVERSDGEHHASQISLTRTIAPFVPDVGLRAAGKRWLRPMREASRRRRHRRRVAPWSVPASAELLAETRAHCAAIGIDASLPIKVGDVSDNYIYTFEEFEDAVLRSACVVTTRLHVGILAALVGVPTALRDGRYGKLGGVHDVSMRDMPHVTLLNGSAP